MAISRKSSMIEACAQRSVQLESAKKNPVPITEQGRQDGRVVHARGCLQTCNHQNSQRCCYVNCFYCYFVRLLLPLQLLRETVASKCYYFRCHCSDAVVFFELLQYSPVPRLQLLLTATPGASRRSHRSGVLSIASTLRNCPAAFNFDHHGKLTSTVRFKTTRGETASMGSVICRSMENSVCEDVRSQLAEAKGIGRLIWRMDVTGDFVGDERRRSQFRPATVPRGSG